MIGGFAKARLESLSEALTQDFAALLKLPDPELEQLIWGKAVLEQGSALADILRSVQEFHGIG